MMGGSTGDHAPALTCQGPTPPSGQVVAVTDGDMGMTHLVHGPAPVGGHMRLLALPASVRPGQLTLVVSNRGWRTHELVILRLGSGMQAGQRRAGPDGKVPEDASLGEASRSCAAGKGDGIRSGSVGWVTVTLPAGRYELLCNLENHYADGMHQELAVI
jgi:uncharacterized cupredoxin-like copper-binding protein